MEIVPDVIGYAKLCINMFPLMQTNKMSLTANQFNLCVPYNHIRNVTIHIMDNNNMTGMCASPKYYECWLGVELVNFSSV